MSRTIIVIPCYNEAKRLPVHEFLAYARDRCWVRFLLVNDGSTDETRLLLQHLRRSAAGQFAIHDLPRNAGKAEAVRQGMLRATAENPEFVGFWDADLATPLEAVDEFCDVLRRRAHVQIAIGARVRLLGRRIERRPWRHCLGRIFATAASLVLKLPVYDTQCGAKLFRVSPQLSRHLEHPFCTNWIFDVELLARFIRQRRFDGLPGLESVVHEIPLRQWVDVADSKVKARDFAKAAVELARIYRTYLHPGAAAPQPCRPIVPSPHLKPRSWRPAGADRTAVG